MLKKIKEKGSSIWAEITRRRDFKKGDVLIVFFMGVVAVSKRFIYFTNNVFCVF